MAPVSGGQGRCRRGRSGRLVRTVHSLCAWRGWPWRSQFDVRSSWTVPRLRERPATVPWRVHRPKRGAGGGIRQVRCCIRTLCRRRLSFRGAACPLASPISLPSQSPGLPDLPGRARQSSRRFPAKGRHPGSPAALERHRATPARHGAEARRARAPVRRAELCQRRETLNPARPALASSVPLSQSLALQTTRTGLASRISSSR
jgi:hypothetical protein